MTDPTPPQAAPPETDSAAPNAEPVETTRPEIRETRLDRKISWIWLAPLGAVLMAGLLAWRDYQSRGVMITVSFETASGVEAGSTRVKHRDVEVGLVERVGFTEDLRSVALHVRMEPDMEPYLNETTQFWIVRPRISAAGVSGLETVLSGAFLEMDWGIRGGEDRREFDGLADPPLTPAGTPGMRILLRASEGGIGVGAPILFRRIQVGRIETQALTADGAAVEMQAFVNAPHHERLSRATRFWNASGLDFQLGADGVKARVESLSALLEGGVAFDTLPLPSASQPAREGDGYILYAAEQEARESIFEDASGSEIRLAARFDESVRGLTVGAPVEYRGVRIGEVTAISVRPNPATARIDILATMVIQPGRLGLEDPDPETTFHVLGAAVENGLRARLAQGSFLTGALFVELAEVPDAPLASLDPEGIPYPTIPTVRAPSLQSLTETAQSFISGLNALPLAETLQTAQGAIQDVRSLIGGEEVQGVPGQVSEILGSAQMALEGAARLLADPALARLPARLDAVGADAERIAADLAGLTGSAGVASLSDRIETIGAGAEQVASNLAALTGDAALTALPGRVEAAAAQIETAATNLANLTGAPELAALPAQLQAIGADAQRITGDLSTFFADQAFQTLPRRLNDALAKIEALEIEALLASARAAMDEARRLIASEHVQGMPLRAAATLDAARSLLADPSFRQTGQEAAAALAQARTLIQELRAAGTTQNLNAALVGAQGAGRAIEAAAAALPVTLAQINAAAARAENMLADFGPGAPGNYELILTLRELRAAAGKLYELTDTLQRQPNSIIFGK